jgi:hypothetical protein
LEQYNECRYSVITEIIINCNENASKRYRIFKDSSFEWFARQTILESIDALLTEDGFGMLIISGSLPKTQHLTLSDTIRGIIHEVVIESRRIGEDNGKDVLINWGNQFKNIVELMRKDYQRLPENTKTRLYTLLEKLP